MLFILISIHHSYSICLITMEKDFKRILKNFQEDFKLYSDWNWREKKKSLCTL